MIPSVMGTSGGGNMRSQIKKIGPNQNAPFGRPWGGGGEKIQLVLKTVSPRTSGAYKTLWCKKENNQ